MSGLFIGTRVGVGAERTGVEGGGGGGSGGGVGSGDAVRELFGLSTMLGGGLTITI